MGDKKSCNCSTAPRLIFPCSGASDTGEITDRAARELTRSGIGKMACLAGIGGKVSGIVASAEAASQILVIDGCPLECAKKTMDQAGISNYSHLRITDLGLEKGKSPLNEERLNIVMKQAKDIWGN